MDNSLAEETRRDSYNICMLEVGNPGHIHKAMEEELWMRVLAELRKRKPCMDDQDSLVGRLRTHAAIRRKIPRGEPDRISDILEEAASRIEELERKVAERVAHG